MSGQRIALVTDELSPWTRGGIGRLLAHLIDDALLRDTMATITVVVPHGNGLTTSELTRTWGPRVRLVHGEAPRPGRHADHAQGVALMRTLDRLARENQPFDAVEFSDYRGWAFASLEEKQLGRAFGGTRLGVRLHGPASLIAWREGAGVDPHAFELERLSLLHAETVVAHLATTADAVASFFGFDARWRSGVRVEFPPLGRRAPVPGRAVRGSARDLVFPTKLQAIKRPDLFVAGAARVMRRRPDWRGRAILAAARPSAEVAAAIDSLVPPRLAHRFVLHAGSQAERAALFATSVVVVPSDFEAFSLAAWEAAMQGAPLVLSSKCPAFAPGTPLGSWDGTVHFDGTVDSLAHAMDRALDLEAGPCAPPPAAAPWWLEPGPSRPPPPSPGRPGVSVVVLDEGDDAALAATLASLTSGTVAPVETLVGAYVQRSIEPPAVLVELDLPTRFPAGASWCELVRATRSELVMAVRAGDLVDRDYLEMATHALGASANLVAVVPSVDGEGLLGCAPTAGLREPLVAVAGTVWRRGAWRQAPEDAPSLDALCWALGLDCALAGQRLVAAQQVGVSAGRELAVNPEYLHRRLPVPLPPSIHPLALAGVRVPAARPLRHRLVDALDARLRATLPGARDVLRRLTDRLGQASR